MAGRSAPAYSFRFYRKGRFVAANRLRYADSFEIWKGKRQVTARRDFPFKRVGERRELLEQVVYTIERKRLEANERRRRARVAARLKKQEQEEARRIARERRKKKRKPEKRFTAEDERIWASKFALPVFEETREVEPYEWPNVAEEGKLLIPVRPEGREYTSELVSKDLVWRDGRRSAYSILNYTLRDEYVIPVSAEIFEEAFNQMFRLFFPMMVAFWEGTKNSSDGYILRIKFGWTPEGEEETVLQGLSLNRRDIHSLQHLQETIQQTFMLFFGSDGRNNLMVRNYLQQDTMIFIRGFSFESYIYEIKK